MFLRKNNDFYFSKIALWTDISQLGGYIPVESAKREGLIYTLWKQSKHQAIQMKRILYFLSPLSFIPGCVMVWFLSPYFFTECSKDSINFSDVRSGLTMWIVKQLFKGWEHCCATEHFWVIIATQPANIQLSGIVSSEVVLLVGWAFLRCRT